VQFLGERPGHSGGRLSNAEPHSSFLFSFVTVSYRVLSFLGTPVYTYAFFQGSSLTIEVMQESKSPGDVATSPVQKDKSAADVEAEQNEKEKYQSEPEGKVKFGDYLVRIS